MNNCFINNSLCQGLFKKGILLGITFLLIISSASGQVVNTNSDISKIGNYIKNVVASIKLPKLPKFNISKKEKKATDTIIAKAPRVQKIRPSQTSKIKVVLPTIDFSKLHFLKKKSTGINISNAKLKVLKKNKISQINDQIEALDFKIQKLEEKKLDILESKNDLIHDLAVLKIQDSLKTVLAYDIIDANTKEVPLFTIPVGFTDMDEQVRNLILLGKLPADNSLTIRPYFTTNKQTFSKIVSLIDSNLNYEGTIYDKHNINVTLLPFSFTQKLNSDHPFGGNDGSMTMSKGYQFQVSTGVFVQLGHLKIQFRPEYVNTASDPYQSNNYWGAVTPAVKKLSLGQSSIRYDFGKLTVSAGTENLWWGPGIQNSILMSNNAPGFFHYSFQTNRPIKNFLGTFQFHIIGATLTRDSLQGFENYGLKTRNLKSGDRYLNSLAIDYTPSFLKNISFGINRSIQTPAAAKVSGLINGKIPALGAFFGATAAASDTFPRDQLVSVYTRWFFPKDHAELYYQFAYNDAKENLRDLGLDMSHSTAYILGFKKLFTLQDQAYLDLNVEAIKLAQTPSYLHRNAGNFYEHGQILEGYTNQNQIMGSGDGFGNNSQSFLFSYNKGWAKYGFKFKHIANQPMALVNGFNYLGLSAIKWDDYVYGLQSKYRYKNILLSANLDWVHSRNYLWKDGNMVGNFYAYINTVFLW
jgi:hypothetical protein